MGLLEKATKFAGLAGDGATAGSEAGGTSAPFGLRARAEMLFQRTAPPAAALVPQPGAVTETTPAPAAPGGIAIHGLRARAEAMRAAIPPLPESARMGLLARATRMRSAATVSAETADLEVVAPMPVAPVAEGAGAPEEAVQEATFAEEPPAAESSGDSEVLGAQAATEFELDSMEFSEPEFSSAADELAIADAPDTIAETVPSASADDPVLAFDEPAPAVPPERELPDAPIVPEVESLEAEVGLTDDQTNLTENEAEFAEEEALVFDSSEIAPESVASEGAPEDVVAEAAVGSVPQSGAGRESDGEAREGTAGPADPRFDDLLPEDHVPVEAPLAVAELEATETEPAVEAAQSEASERIDSAASAPLPALDDPDQDTAHLVHDELRDFDAFLDREIIPDDLPEAAPVPPAVAAEDTADHASDSAGSEAEGLFADEAYEDQDPGLERDQDSAADAVVGSEPTAPDRSAEPVDLEPRFGEDGLPQLPYAPPAAAADPARDSGGEPNLDEDPFGLWEQDAEREAEEHARQLELRGEVPGAHEIDGEEPENLLFEADEGFTTAPAEAHIASQKKIDHYLSLFDITKEISNISEFDELWENILYAIMGQVGAETICILSSTQRVSSGAIFYPVAHSGFELPEGWALKRGDVIYDQTAAANGIRYADEFLNSLQNPISPLERRILENTKAQVVVPLKNMGQMFGIVILGGQVSGDDYTIDDLEFLTLLGEIAAVGVDRVLSRIEFERDTEELRRRNMVHGSMFSLARRASGVKSLDEMYDILTRHLREDFSAQSFSLVLLSPRDRKYRIFAGNEISPASIERFALDVNSELVATISNLVRVYDLKDFRENREIASCYTNDDIGLMQHYWIVPLINMNWLVGFITVHRTSVSWTEFHRELMVTAAEIVSPVFANCIIMGERESLFRDPFSPLETRLTQELERADQFRSPLSLVDIRVKNIRRLLELNPGEEVTAFLMALNRSIASALFETDFMARVGQGRFALILPGRARAEAEVFVKKLTSEFKRLRLLPASPVDVQYAHQIISAPADADQAGKMLSIFE